MAIKYKIVCNYIAEITHKSLAKETIDNDVWVEIGFGF